MIGFVLITAKWYRGAEQAFRIGIWGSFNGVAAIVGGLIAFGVNEGFNKNGYSFRGWKAIFLITGLATTLYGAAFFAFFPDSPLTAKFLTEEERHVAVERLRKNQQGIGSKTFKWHQLREAMLDVRVSSSANSNRERLKTILNR